MGIVKREIPIKNDVNFNTLPVNPVQAQQGYMQPQAPMVNGRFVDQNGRPIPVPNYGQAQVVGYANQQPVNQPMMQTTNDAYAAYDATYGASTNVSTTHDAADDATTRHVQCTTNATWVLSTTDDASTACAAS